MDGAAVGDGGGSAVHGRLGGAVSEFSGERGDSSKSEERPMRKDRQAFLRSAIAIGSALMAVSLLALSTQQPGSGGSNVPAETEAVGERAAWASAEHNSSPSAYLDFAKRFPQSAHIKRIVGTIRGRYWFKVSTSFGNDDKGRKDGVVVTVDGQSAARSLTTEEGVKLGVLKQSPAGQDRRLKTSGMAFNSVYVEPTGPVVARGQLFTPVDLLNCPIILSADGTQLLAWDSSRGTEARSIYQGATIKRDANGEFACGDACPGP